MDPSPVPTPSDQDWRTKFEDRGNIRFMLMQEVDLKMYAPFEAATVCEKAIWERSTDEADYRKQISDVFATLKLFPDFLRKKTVRSNYFSHTYLTDIGSFLAGMTEVLVLPVDGTIEASRSVGLREVLVLPEDGTDAEREGSFLAGMTEVPVLPADGTIERTSRSVGLTEVQVLPEDGTDAEKEGSYLAGLTEVPVLPADGTIEASPSVGLTEVQVPPEDGTDAEKEGSLLVGLTEVPVLPADGSSVQLPVKPLRKHYKRHAKSAPPLTKHLKRQKE